MGGPSESPGGGGGGQGGNFIEGIMFPYWNRGGRAFFNFFTFKIFYIP